MRRDRPHSRTRKRHSETADRPAERALAWKRILLEEVAKTQLDAPGIVDLCDGHDAEERRVRVRFREAEDGSVRRVEGRHLQLEAMSLGEKEVAIQRQVELRGGVAANIRAAQRGCPQGVGCALHPDGSIGVEPPREGLAIIEFGIAVYMEVRVAHRRA